MSERLAMEAELDKLGTLIELSEEDRRQLRQQFQSADLAEWRKATRARIFEYRSAEFRRLALWLRGMPRGIVAELAHRGGPRLSARVLGHMNPYAAAAVARRLPPEFLMDTALAANPDDVRKLVGLLPAELVRTIALAMIRDQRFVACGELTDALDPQAIQAIIREVDDDESLLLIAFYMERVEQLDTIVRLIDTERLGQLIRFGASTPSRWPLLLGVIEHVSPDVASRLVNLMAQSETRSLNELLNLAYEKDLWEPVFRGIQFLSSRHYRAVSHLEALRDPQLLSALIQRAHELGYLGQLIPLTRAMNDDFRRIAAQTGLRQGTGIAENFIQEAIRVGQSDLLLEFVGLLPEGDRRELGTLPLFERPYILHSLVDCAMERGLVGNLLLFTQFLDSVAKKHLTSLLLEDQASRLETLMARLRDCGKQEWRALGDLMLTVSEENLPAVKTAIQFQAENTRQHITNALAQSERWLSKLGLAN